MNDALDNIRRSLYREEKDLNKRKVLKGTRWLLLCNGKDIFDYCCPIKIYAIAVFDLQSITFGTFVKKGLAFSPYVKLITKW